MAIIFDDKKSINDYLKKPDIHPESFTSLCKRQTVGLKLVSDDMEQEKKEQEEVAKLLEKRFERKKKLLFDNLDLILRHKDEILETPRYANIDAHYAIKGGGCYVGPISTSKHYNFAGTLVIINLKLGELLELWDNEQFKIPCKCGSTAVIHYFSGSPLSGGSIATSICPNCKEQIHNIRGRSFGKYMGHLLLKMRESTEKVAKSVTAQWTLAESEYEKKVAEGHSSCWYRKGAEFHGDGKSCDLETMINELQLKEFAQQQ